MVLSQQHLKYITRFRDVLNLWIENTGRISNSVESILVLRFDLRQIIQYAPDIEGESAWHVILARIQEETAVIGRALENVRSISNKSRFLVAEIERTSTTANWILTSSTSNFVPYSEA